MRRTLCLLLLGVASCEPPASDHPLSDPAAAKVDSKLVGMWRGQKDGDVVFLHVTGKEKGLLDLTLLGNDTKKGSVVLTFEGFASELGGKKYLNLKPKTAKGDPWEDAWDVRPRYIFAQYELKGGGVNLMLMRDAPLVKDAVKDGKLAGKLDGDNVVLTEETPKLAAWVQAADHSKLFETFATFKPMK
jgi:hypothetical protein